MLDALTAAMRAAQPEIVFHLAAQPLVRPSYADPVETFATNVDGHGPCARSRAAHRPTSVSVVVVTSDKCYENRRMGLGLSRDRSAGRPRSVSSSKGCAELVTAAYRARSSRDGAARQSPRRARATSSAAATGRHDRLIPDFFRALDAGGPLRIRSPDAMRPWQHVLEPLAGYLALAERAGERRQRVRRWLELRPADDDARPVRWILECSCGSDPARGDVGRRRSRMNPAISRWTAAKRAAAWLVATLESGASAWSNARLAPRLAPGADMRAITLNRSPPIMRPASRESATLRP